MGPLQAWQLEEPSLGEATRVPAESDRRRLREQAGPEAREGRTRARALRVHLHCAAQPRATGSHGCSAQCALARPRATGSHGRLCSASRTLSESLHARGASNVRTPNGHTAHEHDGSAACRSTTSPMGGVCCDVSRGRCVDGVTLQGIRAYKALMFCGCSKNYGTTQSMPAEGVTAKEMTQRSNTSCNYAHQYPRACVQRTCVTACAHVIPFSTHCAHTNGLSSPAVTRMWPLHSACTPSYQTSGLACRIGC